MANNSSIRITYDEALTNEIIRVLDMCIDDKGAIRDKNGKLVPSISGVRPVYSKDVAGIVNTRQGVRLVRNNILDLISFVDKMEN